MCYINKIYLLTYLLEGLEDSIRNVASLVNQQDTAQEVMISQGEPFTSLLPQSQGAAEGLTPSLSKEHLLSSSRAATSPLGFIDDKGTREEVQRDYSSEGSKVGIDAVISTPDKEAQKQKGNILLEVAEAFPLSLSLLSGTSTLESPPDDNNQDPSSSIVLPTQEHGGVTDWTSNSTPFLDFDEIDNFSTTTQMKELVLQKDLSPRSKKKKRLKSNSASPT